MLLATKQNSNQVFFQQFCSQHVLPTYDVAKLARWCDNILLMSQPNWAVFEATLVSILCEFFVLIALTY